MAYHSFKDDEGNAYGSFEVFYADDLECHGCGDCEGSTPEEQPGHLLPAGWFWWACFPGCMPDGDAHGPFATESEATSAALEES